MQKKLCKKNYAKKAQAIYFGASARSVIRPA